ncbi:siderophore-interacting protein [Jiangella endophytica]|uniref:siderophore-interacting protein n=1 Tax=Jiangella endophytica TaxID=1623398 RepID=UPI001E4C946D|nr:siderophore-interacting protein [Jiangella endophytica]
MRRGEAPRVSGVRLTYSELRVVGCEAVTPRMRRVTLAGDGLAGFTPVAPDQQVKLFFARDGGVPEVPDPPAGLDDVAGWYQRYLAMPDERRPWMRTYSIRRHRSAAREVDVDFVLHGDGEHDGPASRWAAAAGPGDAVGLYGPSVSHLRTPGRHDWKLFAGDETALPAIGAWLESLGPDERAVVVAEVAGPEEEQRLDSPASVTVLWRHRGSAPAGRSDVLADAVRELDFPDGEPFAWVAGEASAVRDVRRHLVGERGVDRRAVAFAGYWRVDRTHDDASTAEELADHAEASAG